MTINLGISSKITIGLTTAGAIAAGGYITNEHLSGTKITELLLKNDLTLLNKNDDKKQWGKRWQEYVKKNKNKWELLSYQENINKSDDAPHEFKDACIYKASKRINNNQRMIYDDIVDYCTKDFPISALIKQDQSIQLISEKTEPSAGNDKWKAIWGKYFESEKNKNPLGVALGDRPNKETVPTDYSKKCEEKQNIEVKNKNDNAYLIFKKWCTESKTTRR